MIDKGKHGKGDQRQREKDNRGDTNNMGNTITLRIRRNLIGTRYRGAAALFSFFKSRTKAITAGISSRIPIMAPFEKSRSPMTSTIHIYRKGDGFPADDKRYAVIGKNHRKD